MGGLWGGEYGQEDVSYGAIRAECVDVDGGWEHGGNEPTPLPFRPKGDAGANRKRPEHRKAAGQHHHPGGSHSRQRPAACPPPVHYETQDSLPFCTAARKLRVTLTRSIDYFKRFYREFQKETRALSTYADLDLINRAWQRKIRNSERYLRPRSKGGKDNAGRKDQGGFPGDNTNNSDNGNGGTSGQDAWKSSIREDMTYEATIPDLRTFSELQREVIERVTALYQAKLPQSRLRAPTDKHSLSSYPNSPFGSYSDDEDYSGPEDRQILEQWKLALTLKRHVQDSYGQLIRVVRAMDKDYMAVTPAARELEMLKRDLEIYRRGWDETYRNEEDDEDGDEGRGDKSRAETEEMAAGGGF
ncbi:hypothetical protein A1O3_03293 [Capronia epimyces CBS 606.96]|uniref:Uncharacterized protein n=1 Tax=Capronia epimyces CBS 606.96 TaxID=1182542 RepID=W9Y0P4_9EURO|nr:uncharacterized protein A1O3_03293 [Capronia epimyces CBS 606.96]EXJ86342.1 hypothetical protein A1O3_03293 [Capronia epimyces CBS 606.96]